MNIVHICTDELHWVFGKIVWLLFFRMFRCFSCFDLVCVSDLRTVSEFGFGCFSVTFLLVPKWAHSDPKE